VATDRPDFLPPEGSALAPLPSQVISTTVGQFDVSQYGSVVVVISGGTAGKPAVCGYKFTDSTGTIVYDAGLLTSASIGVTTDVPTYILPVSGPLLILTTPSAGTGVFAYGNTIRRSKQCGSDFQPALRASCALPASTAAGTITLMTIGDSNAFSQRPCANQTSYNGLCTMVFTSNQSVSGAVRGFFYDATGTLINRLVMQPQTFTGLTIQCGHPFAFIQWGFVTSAITAASITNITMDIIPSYSALT
jgi:hypothetical protein